jgi:PAS domain S-box-containing protein
MAAHLRQGGIDVVGQDASERPPALTSLAGILESITVGVHVYDSQWRVTYMNPVARRLAESQGQDPEWMLGKHLWNDVFPRARDGENAKKAQQAMKERVAVSFENYHADYRKWFETHVFPLPDGGLGVVFNDVTERKIAEEESRAMEARFRALSDCAPFILWITDAQGRTTFANRTLLEFVGLTVEQAATLDWNDILHPEDRHASEAFAAALRDRRVFHERMRVRRHDGTWRWVESRGNPQLDASGQLIAYIGCSADITDMVESKAALEEVAGRKDRFLAVLAHELRNPLASILSATRLLRTTSGSSTEHTRAMIEREVGHLTRLVDDLLDIERIKSGRIVLRRETVDVRAIVSRAVEMTRPLLDECQHRLAIVLPGEPLLVDADAARLVQVLVNLLGNAAKFTPNAGDIRVTGRRSGEQVEIIVADTGIGIAPEDLPRILETFDSTGRQRADGGLGIGLALTRQLVELHGGSVKASSAGADQGSEFVVRLPLAVAARPPEAPPRRHHARRSTRPRRILLIDDNRFFAEAMTGLLDSMGHQVCTIHEGSTALATARRFEPDVVLLDIGLPGVAGYDVARELRRDPTLAKVKLIAMTGYGREQDKRRALAAGFDHHLTKPVDEEGLASLIEEAPARAARK